MKVTHQAAQVGHDKIMLQAPMRPVLSRAHTDSNTDSFCRSKHGRPKMHRRAHSDTRLPKPDAKPKTAAEASTFSADVGVSARSIWQKALGAAVRFAEFFIGLLLDYGMQRAGQHFTAAPAVPAFGLTALPAN